MYAFEDIICSWIDKTIFVELLLSFGMQIFVCVEYSRLTEDLLDELIKNRHLVGRNQIWFDHNVLSLKTVQVLLSLLLYGLLFISRLVIVNPAL